MQPTALTESILRPSPDVIAKSLEASRSSVSALAGVLAIAVLAALATLLVAATGGTPNSLVHAGYLSIVLAAFLFGWRGSIPTAVLVAAAVGPLSDAVGVPTDGPQAWLTRGLSFVGIGAVVGALFDAARRAVADARQRADQLRAQERAAVIAFARGAEAKDEETGLHVMRVQASALAIARAVGLSADEAERIGWSAMLHDVGKLHVPDRVLLKPGPLDHDEWAIMRQHPIWGERILGDADGFAVARRIARWHHEDWAGSGYPDGLAGEAIPLEARIVRVADAFDAMISDRPYASARPVEAALEELDRCAGTAFDPDLVRLFIDLVRADATIGRRYEIGPAQRFFA